ncbi:hypothetical protein GH714_006882 [Hevea brasiliensis]|uniref:Uncharacterized protein n=1 Tax=Hevea brasiliensis TaxID=3981 RepID=A0A6A6LAF4_HEVBR|nr:hypothetical protein GH714_006882 [Hevea brasiliensis]
MQTQLYRLTEHFLRKVNLPEIHRTAETELAVADAINIEKIVADKSNSKIVYLNLCSQEIIRCSDNSESIRAKESNSSTMSLQPTDQSEQASDKLPTDPAVRDALRNAGLLSDSPPSSPCHNKEASNEVDDSPLQNKEEGPDNIFEIDSLPEVDIYGDFEYDLEDEDYIGAAALKVPKLQPEETESRMNVVFSTLQSERLNDVLDFEYHKRLGDIEESKHSSPLLKNHNNGGTISSTIEVGTDKSCVPQELLLGEEPFLAECEELYGPDKEPLVHKFPEDSLIKLSGQVHAEAPAENDDLSQVKRAIVASVETYVKEHIRPLCKSGIITVEQYKWAVAKTTDKVMKYHMNAKNANVLIKEGTSKLKELQAAELDLVNVRGRKDLSFTKLNPNEEAIMRLGK